MPVGQFLVVGMVCVFERFEEVVKVGDGTHIFRRTGSGATDEAG